MHTFLLILIGLAAGLAAGLFGVGGGVVIVPALVYFLGFSQHKATGTSLAVLLPPVGLAAVIEYHRHGNADLKAALVIIAALFLGAWLSAYTANKLSGQTLRLLFGVFLLAMGAYTIADSLRKQQPTPPKTPPKIQASSQQP